MLSTGRLVVMALSLALLGAASWGTFTSAGIAASRDVGVAAVARGASVRTQSTGTGGTGRLRVK